MVDADFERAATEQFGARAVDCSDAWALDYERRVLLGRREQIALTASEALILKDFVASEQRVLNKADILACLNKDSGNYTGLVMCISRLQGKFKKVSGGAGLFRSVRNRGYCLVQKIELLS
jgi:two-component system, OmpR family, response regulator